jgi:hypothetical protein
MAHCFVCRRAQGRVLLWRLASEVGEDLECKAQALSRFPYKTLSDAYSNHDPGRLVYEQGLSPCCAWPQINGARERLKRRAQKKVKEASPDELRGARELLKPGAGLDRSFLDGLCPTSWVASAPIDILGANCQLSARIKRGPASAAAFKNGETTASIDIELLCKTGEITRSICFPVEVPAPIGGYITAVHKNYGVRLCVNLRTVPKVNEVEVRGAGSVTEASILLGPTSAENRNWIPRNLKLAVHWKGNEAYAATLHASKNVLPKVNESRKRSLNGNPKKENTLAVSLAHVLRALFGLSTHVLGAETLEKLLAIIRMAVRRRTPPTFSEQGILQREPLMEMQAASLLLVDLTMLPSEEHNQFARSVAAMLLRSTDAPQVNFPDLLLEALLKPGTCAVTPETEEQAWKSADALDCLARLLCASFAVHLAVGLKEPAEQATDTLAPCSISMLAIRKAIEDSLLHISRDVVNELRREGAAEPTSEGKKLRGYMVNWKEGTPKEIQRHRPLLLHWRTNDANCPFCGTVKAKENEICTTCASEAAAETALYLLESNAGAHRFQIQMSPGSSYWQDASRARLLHAVAWAAKSTQSNEIVLNSLMRRLVAAEFVNTLPAFVIKRLRGSGVKASEPIENKGIPRPKTPCLISEDVTLHDATIVTTGIRSSQVHSAWPRRRACKRKRGSMCLYMLNEKTTQQTRAVPPGILFAPSALHENEDERAVVEATQAAVNRVKTLFPGSLHFAKVVIEGCNLAHQVAKWKNTRASIHLRCPGDDLGLSPCEEVLVTLEQAAKLPRAIREELNARLGDFRVHEEVMLPGRKCGQVLRRVTLHLKGHCEPVSTDKYTVGNRLPRVGDILTLEGNASVPIIRIEAVEVFVADEQMTTMLPPALLSKLPRRQGDNMSFSPLAYVNAIFAERQGHVNVRLNQGHTTVLVQTKPLINYDKDPAALVLHQLQNDQLGLWHVDTIAFEEHHLREDQAQKDALPPGGYTLPLGELQLHCARALALPPPPGHAVRQGPLLRALLSCCTSWRGFYQATNPLMLEHTLQAPHGSSASPSVIGQSAWGSANPEWAARAHVALFAVVLLDEVDGTSYEDAGSTDLNFGLEQGRCFFMTTKLTPKATSCILTKDQLEDAARKAPIRTHLDLQHLDASGRARGFVLKGAVLAYLKDGSRFRAPFDAWVEAWTTTRRGIPAVLLMQEHGWQSGIKVVGMLQKSVLTAIPNGLFAPVPTSFLRAESSCVSRNAPGTYVSSLALRLLLARGLRMQSCASQRRLPATSSIFMKQDCCLQRVEAARELTWGLCRDDRFPVLSQAQGTRSGLARILLQEMGIPLDKAAPHVLTPHIGGRQRRGFRKSQGQSLEVMELEITRTPLEGPRGFDATRSVQEQELVRPHLVEAWRTALSLFNCGIYRAE